MQWKRDLCSLSADSETDCFWVGLLKREGFHEALRGLWLAPASEEAENLTSLLQGGKDVI